MTLTFSTTSAGGVTRLAASAGGDRTAGNASIGEIIVQLDARFQRAAVF